MIIEQMSISAPPGKRKQLGSALSSLIGPTQVQAGCLSCRLFQNWQDLDELLVEASWETQEDLIRHLQSDTYKRMLLMIETSRIPPVLRFSSVQDVSGLELVLRARTTSAAVDSGQQ
jgi:quinol monooxygenase YgiN